jgi:hypothetical protein
MNLTIHVEGKISKNPSWIAEVFYGKKIIIFNSFYFILFFS